MKQDNLICVCGCSKSEHKHIPNVNIKLNSSDMLCKTCFLSPLSSFHYQKRWHNFKLDNLKYLESLYAEKSK